MSVAISWANKMQLAKCDIMVGFPISSHISYDLAVFTKISVHTATYVTSNLSPLFCTQLREIPKTICVVSATLVYT